jgi:hypothetical protein
MPSRPIRLSAGRQSPLSLVADAQIPINRLWLPRTDVGFLCSFAIGIALAGPACSSSSSGNVDSSAAGVTGTGGSDEISAAGSGTRAGRAGSPAQGPDETGGAAGGNDGTATAGASAKPEGGGPNVPVETDAGAPGTGETGGSPGAAGSQGEAPRSGAGGEESGVGGTDSGAAGAPEGEGGGDGQVQGEPGPIGTGEIASATIAAGQTGEVELESVKIQFLMPLSQQTDVQIESTTDDVRGDFQRYTPVYRFTPEGLSGIMATVTFTVPADAIAPTIYWSKANGEPGFDQLTTQGGDGQLAAQVSHFSQGFVAGPALSGPAGVLVTGGVALSGALAVDADNVYFTSDYHAEIYSAPLSGGSPTVLPNDGVSLAGATDILVQGSDLFVVDDGGIDGQVAEVVRMDLDGTNAAKLAGDSWISGLRLDVNGDALYWISGNSAIRQVRRFSLPDGPTETIGGGQDGATSVTTDDDWVYYADSRGVQRVGRDGQGKTTLVSWVNNVARQLVVQDGFAYVVEFDAADAAAGFTLSRLPTGQAGQSLDDGQVLASGLQEPSDMALDGGFVYYIERGTTSDGTQPADGKLSKVPADGSAAPTTLASGLRNPSRLVVRGSSVYYTLLDASTNGNSGLVRSLDK